MEVLRPFSRNVKKVEQLGVFSWSWIDQIMNAKPSPKLRWHYFNLWAMAGFHIWHELFFEKNDEAPYQSSFSDMERVARASA